MFKVCSLSVLEDFLGQDDLAMIKMIVVWKIVEIPAYRTQQRL